MPADPALTDELASLLFGLPATGLSTAALTRRITHEIVSWARDHGWHVRTEGRFEVPGAVARTRLGFVDVLISRGDPQPDLAIEIDSTDKPWSVVKLQHAALAGMHAIWIRWGDDDWAGVYDDVDVIQLRIGRRVRHALRSTEQETIWK